MIKVPNPEIMFEKYINTPDKNLRILGNFDKTEYDMISDDELSKMTPKEYQEFIKRKEQFFATSRKHGLDGSVELGIGGSDMGTINGCGISGSTPSKLYCEKALGMEFPSSATQLNIFEAGHRAEPYIAESFEMVTGIPVVHWPLQIINEKYPHCIANVDGLVLEDGKIGIYEGKTAQFYSSQRKWMQLKNNGNNDITFIEPRYRLQVWYYLAVYELDFAYICGGWGFNRNDIAYCRIDRADPETEAALMENAESFITDYCLKKIRPSDLDVKKKSSVIEAHSTLLHKFTRSKKPVVLDASYGAIFERALELKEKYNSMQSEVNKLNEAKAKVENEYNACIATIAEKCLGAYEGEVLYKGKKFYFSARFKKEGKKIDTQMLKRENPSVYDEVKQERSDVNLEKLRTRYPKLYNKYLVDASEKITYKISSYDKRRKLWS